MLKIEIKTYAMTCSSINLILWYMMKMRESRSLLDWHILELVSIHTFSNEFVIGYLLGKVSHVRDWLRHNLRSVFKLSIIMRLGIELVFELYPIPWCVLP